MFNFSLSQALNGRRAFCITHPLLQTLYGKWIEERVPNVEWILVPEGEESKSLKEKEGIEEALFRRGCDRVSVLIAFGGGVISDLVGFVAATYMRGISLFLIPTTLLAMVDASIGGKTGINTFYGGKNSVGAFYLPEKVYYDPLFLSTLPMDEWKEGFVEMVKIALVSNKDFFNSLSFPPTWEMIKKAISLKQAIVEHDLYDRQERQKLNFGHTFAHALESATGYGISHGKAVNQGLLFESILSDRGIERLIEQKIPFPPPFSLIPVESLLIEMKKDKKREDKNQMEYPFVQLSEIGSAYLSMKREEEVLETYEQFKKRYGR